MYKYTILHNPRCSKSRMALKILQDNGLEIEIIDYQHQYLSVSILKGLQKLLGGISALTMTRNTEKEFALCGLKKTSTDDEIFLAIVKYPNLLQRPIVIKANTTAIIGREEQVIQTFLTHK